MSRKVPLTIAQQIAQESPYHPAAHHGRREVKEKKDKKHTEKILKINDISSSIVDKWMKDMAKKHNPSDNGEYLGPEDITMRQPRLGLGAKFLSHSKAVKIHDKETKTLHNAILKKTKGTQIIQQETPPSPQEQQTEKGEEVKIHEDLLDPEDSKIESIKQHTAARSSGIPKPQGVKKKKKSKKKRRSNNWY